MSKKHFEKFAAALALINDDPTRAEVRDVIVNVCRESNGSFRTSTFDQAIADLRAGERPHGFNKATYDEFCIRQRGLRDAA